MSKWFGKKEEDVPDELKNMSSEDLLAAVEASKKVKGLEEELARRPSQEALDGIAADLESTKNALKDLENRGRGDGGGGNGGQPERKLANFLVEPDKAFAERAAPLAAMTMQIGATTAKDTLRRKLETAQRNGQGNIDGFLFDKFENEIDELAKQVPAASLCQAATWEHLYYNVKGRHADQIAQQQREKKGEFFVETGGAGGNGGRKDDEQVDPPLTDRERHVARSMRLTDEEYKKFKKEQTVSV